jgi:hypothetical protein
MTYAFRNVRFGHVDADARSVRKREDWRVELSRDALAGLAVATQTMPSIGEVTAVLVSSARASFSRARASETSASFFYRPGFSPATSASISVLITASRSPHGKFS